MQLIKFSRPIEQKTLVNKQKRAFKQNTSQCIYVSHKPTRCSQASFKIKIKNIQNYAMVRINNFKYLY